MRSGAKAISGPAREASSHAGRFGLIVIWALAIFFVAVTAVLAFTCLGSFVLGVSISRHTLRAGAPQDVTEGVFVGFGGVEFWRVSVDRGPLELGPSTRWDGSLVPWPGYARARNSPTARPLIGWDRRIATPVWTPSILTEKLVLPVPILITPLALAGWWSVRRVRKLSGRSAGRCARCGYDLRGTAGSSAGQRQCPECGAACPAYEAIT